jgi:hypothetical protein
MKVWAAWGMAAARQALRGFPRFAQKTSSINGSVDKAGM